jgi:molybdate transport system permease protein
MRRLPVVLVLPALLGLAFLVIPFAGLLVRAPWPTLGTRLFSAEVGQALTLSLVCASLATVVCLVLGVPLAWLLARGGVALLLVLGRRGLVGQYLYDWFGVSLPFTTAGVVVAEAFVAMPFLVIAVEGALRAADPRYEEAAATLGASRWLTFRRVTLPSIAPGVVAGTVLCWARALGEFGATITFAGNFPGKTTTMPLAVYLALETDPGAAIVLSLVLLAVSVVVLVSLRDRWISGVT